MNTGIEEYPSVDPVIRLRQFSIAFIVSFIPMIYFVWVAQTYYAGSGPVISFIAWSPVAVNVAATAGYFIIVADLLRDRFRGADYPQEID